MPAKFSTFALNAFLLTAAIFCILTFFEPFPFNWIPKVIPMLILIAVAMPLKQDKKCRWFFIGLIFSACGDVLLALNGGELFVFGLGAFLIAHLFYLAYLLPIEITRGNLVRVLPCLIYGTIMMTILYPNLGPLSIPVVIYMVVLMAMGVAALLSKKSHPWLVLGSISFIVSDSIIGVNKFVVDVPYSHFLIMVSYYFAQICLVFGVFTNQQQQLTENSSKTML